MENRGQRTFRFPIPVVANVLPGPTRTKARSQLPCPAKLVSVVLEAHFRTFHPGLDAMDPWILQHWLPIVLWEATASTCFVLRPTLVIVGRTCGLVNVRNVQQANIPQREPPLARRALLVPISRTKAKVDARLVQRVNSILLMDKLPKMRANFVL